MSRYYIWRHIWLYILSGNHNDNFLVFLNLLPIFQHLIVTEIGIGNWSFDCNSLIISEMCVAINSLFSVWNGHVHLSSSQLYCFTVIERRIYLRRCQVHVFLKTQSHHFVFFSTVSKAAHNLTENFSILQIRIVQHNNAICNKFFITRVIIWWYLMN